jgi:hypothetical protein
MTQPNAINDSFKAKLERQIAQANSTDLSADDGAAGGIPAQIETNTDDEIGQATSKPSTTTAQADTELQQLRAELAARAIEFEALKAAQTQGIPVQDADDEIALYESDDERQARIDALGEDIVIAEERRMQRLLKGVQGKAMAKVSELERHNQTLEQKEKSAEFIRAAGDAIKTFNDPKFQAFAKGERLGRKTMFDELNDIVTGNDMGGIEYLIEQAGAFNGANKALRKAQYGAGRSPVHSEGVPAVFSYEKADKLQRDIRSHRMGTPEAKAAVEKYRKYLEAA